MQVYDITLYYYNPNIHPYKEYLDRRESVRKLSNLYHLPLLEGEYEDSLFLKKMLEDPSIPARCEVCYTLRLQKLQELAENLGIANVSTSLLYSIYQQHDLLKTLAFKIFRKQTFVYHDFRDFFWEGVTLAKEREYYRQKYCGCLFSNYDRYQQKKV